MITLIDSHCHLNPKEYDGDTRPVLARARAAGLVGFLVIGAGAGLEECDVAIAHAEREPDVRAAVAVHPHDVRLLDQAVWAGLEARARHPRVVAIGETGLDYYYDHSPRDAQRSAMRRFVALARAVHKPLSLHIRDAHGEARAIVAGERGEDAGGVIHCFTGGPAEARAWLDLGFHLSFSGIATFKNAEPVREAARLCPSDRILVETDAPYLAPVPLRGQRNEPAFIVHTAALLAGVRGEPIERLADSTTANTRRLFGL